MKKISLFLIGLVFFTNMYAQKSKKKDNEKETLVLNDSTIIREFADKACKCIDSINVFGMKNSAVTEAINVCIDKEVDAYTLIKQISEATKENIDTNGAIKDINIYVNTDKNSKTYKQGYFELERYLMGNCEALKLKINANDQLRINSMSTNEDAVECYIKGMKAFESEQFEKSIKLFKEAVEIDPKFAFAWDNLGLSYRYLGKFDEAIEAYQKSLEVDPYGTMPLQNIAIAYEYKKDYDKAIEAYQRLEEMDANNPEIHYGIGRIYATNNQLEKGLHEMCKAYNLYIELNSPFRTDAEKVINFIYVEMIKQGKEEQFHQILKEYNIKEN